MTVLLPQATQSHPSSIKWVKRLIQNRDFPVSDTKSLVCICIDGIFAAPKLERFLNQFGFSKGLPCSENCCRVRSRFFHRKGCLWRRQGDFVGGQRTDETIVLSVSIGKVFDTYLICLFQTLDPFAMGASPLTLLPEGVYPYQLFPSPLPQVTPTNCCSFNNAKSANEDK